MSRLWQTHGRTDGHVNKVLHRILLKEFAITSIPLHGDFAGVTVEHDGFCGGERIHRVRTRQQIFSLGIVKIMRSGRRTKNAAKIFTFFDIFIYLYFYKVPCLCMTMICWRGNHLFDIDANGCLVVLRLYVPGELRFGPMYQESESGCLGLESTSTEKHPLTPWTYLS